MAVSVGRLAMIPVLTAFADVLDVAAVKTALGYPVAVYGVVPQRKRYPFIRVDGALEVADSTMGVNGKSIAVYVQIFDDAETDLRIIQIGGAVLAILNPAGSYHGLTVTGYRTEHVNFDSFDDAPDEDEAGKRIQHKTMKFTWTGDEA